MIFGREKPLILWLADTPGWAYDSIVQQNTRRLPQFEHLVFYVMSPKDNTFDLSQQAKRATIIVPMYLHYQNLCPQKEKMSLMLTGMRPFE